MSSRQKQTCEQCGRDGCSRPACIRCRKTPALLYPLGCGGQLCQQCVDLQNAEYRQWVAEQRGLGNIPFSNGEPESRLVR